MFMGNVKARGVGEMTFSMGVVTGSATATWRDCAGVSRVRIAGMIDCFFVLARA
jgi:hypothetical protein